MLTVLLLTNCLLMDAPSGPHRIDSTTRFIERPHATEYQRHLDLPHLERSPQWVDRSVKPHSGSPPPSREVLGYLPYWELDYDSLHWDKLTTLAFFAANMESDGSLSNLHGWDGITSTQLRNEAHAHGVRYILTVVNFASQSIDALVNDPDARANGVEQLLGAVLAMDADGVNIDFESVPVSAKAGLTAFVKETTDAFHSAIPGSYVTVATPAVDWSGAFDYDQLAIHSDGLMIMGYGYHWKNGNPGPLSPVTAGELWGEKTLTWTIEDYFEWGGPENHHKYILGLPFYGRDWPSESTEIPGTALNSGVYEPFYDCKARAAALGGFVWDEHSKTSYFMEEIDGIWHQIWCDDGPSWVEKLALVEQYDLQGIGIWALGYDGTTTDYWESIGAAFNTSPAQPASGDNSIGDSSVEEDEIGTGADTAPDDNGTGEGSAEKDEIGTGADTGPDDNGTGDNSVEENEMGTGADTSSNDIASIVEDDSDMYAADTNFTGSQSNGGESSDSGVEATEADHRGSDLGAHQDARNRAARAGGCSTTTSKPLGLPIFITILFVFWGMHPRRRKKDSLTI